MESRRAFLTKVSATVFVGGLISGSAFAAPVMSVATAERLLMKLLGDVEVGDAFHGDFWLLDAYAPTSGALVLVVAAGADGAPLRVDVCRRGDPVRAPAYTESLELYVMDGGDGVKPEPKDLVIALSKLASRLEANGLDGLLAKHLLTHQERLERYPEMMGRASKELAPLGL